MDSSVTVHPHLLPALRSTNVWCVQGSVPDTPSLQWLCVTFHAGSTTKNIPYTRASHSTMPACCRMAQGVPPAHLLHVCRAHSIGCGAVPLHARWITHDAPPVNAAVSRPFASFRNEGKVLQPPDPLHPNLGLVVP